MTLSEELTAQLDRIRGADQLNQLRAAAPVVTMLTDDFTLEDVTLMSERIPPLYSVTFRSTHDAMRRFIATEGQMIRLRDQFDRAADRARSISRQEER